MTFHIVTIFPEIFNSYFNESIIKRAQEKNIIKIKIYDLRSWANDPHKTVDDAPYGGGPGMLMKVEPIYKFLESVKTIKQKNKKKGEEAWKRRVVLLSARGRRWDQQLAIKYNNLDDLILICGHYEGVDERVLNFVDEEISIGDYILTGGEIPAMVLVDSITRLLPSVLGNAKSAICESHVRPGVLEYPQYTRPAEFIAADGRKYKTPEILLSGNHEEIRKWRKKNSRKLKF